MFGNLIAFAFMAAAAQTADGLPSAHPAPVVENVNGWNVASSSQGCMVHAAYRGGTVLSVFALPDQSGIGFLLQNHGWTALEDGDVYPLRIRFAEGGDWTIPAVARLQIDRDGPGLFFSIPPGVLENGRDFVAEFADSSGMIVETRGATLERLALSGSHAATAALARCMSDMVGGGPSNLLGDTAAAATALRI